METNLTKKLIKYWDKSIPNNTIDRFDIPGYDITESINNIKKVPSAFIDRIIELLNSNEHSQVNQFSVKKWDEGWGQNYLDMKKYAQIVPYIVPYYFGKYPLSRVFGEFFVPENFDLNADLSHVLTPKWDIPTNIRWNSTEHSFVRLLMHNLVNISFYNIIKDDNDHDIYIYEFGAGTGHNLFFLKQFMDFYLPEKNIHYVALDWSRSTGNIISLLGDKYSYQFINYYDKNTFPNINNKSYIYSLASFEQIKFSVYSLLEYIVNSKPKFVINVEPIYQTLYPDDLVDKQSIDYMKARKYLPDFLSSLLKLKMIKYQTLHIDILRSGIGSQFIDGYSVVKWFEK